MTLLREGEKDIARGGALHTGDREGREEEGGGSMEQKRGRRGGGVAHHGSRGMAVARSVIVDGGPRYFHQIDEKRKIRV